jgi:hypothetical protein
MICTAHTLLQCYTRRWHSVLLNYFMQYKCTSVTSAITLKMRSILLIYCIIATFYRYYYYYYVAASVTTTGTTNSAITTAITTAAATATTICKLSLQLFSIAEYHCHRLSKIKLYNYM